MIEYALININTLEVIKYKLFQDTFNPRDVTHRGLKWVPVTRTQRPEQNINFLYSTEESVSLDEVVVSWVSTQKTGSALIEAANIEFERRINAVAGSAERDLYLIEAIGASIQGQQIPTAIRNGIIWMRSMGANLRALRTAINGGATPDVTDDSHWTPFN